MGKFDMSLTVFEVPLSTDSGYEGSRTVLVEAPAEWCLEHSIGREVLPLLRRLNVRLEVAWSQSYNFPKQRQC